MILIAIMRPVLYRFHFLRSMQRPSTIDFKTWFDIQQKHDGLSRLFLVMDYHSKMEREGIENSFSQCKYLKLSGIEF